MTASNPQARTYLSRYRNAKWAASGVSSNVHSLGSEPGDTPLLIPYVTNGEGCQRGKDGTGRGGCDDGRSAGGCCVGDDNCNGGCRQQQQQTSNNNQQQATRARGKAVSGGGNRQRWHHGAVALFIKATKQRHRPSTRSDNINLTCLPPFCLV